MEFGSVDEIIKFAVGNEKEAVEFYTSLADQTDKDDVKKVFNILVQEEAKHKLALESLYDDYLADQDS